MASGRTGWFWLATLAVACGRTSPTDGYDSLLASSGGAGGSAMAGGATSGGAATQPGGATSGGSFGAVGGTFGTSGTFGTAGEPMVGGATQTCMLALGNCASDAEPECTDHPRCEGKVLNQFPFDTDRLELVELVTLPDGRMAGTGFFHGYVDFGGRSEPLQQVLPDAQGEEADCFVVLFDSEGEAEWALNYGVAGADTCTGIAATPDGDLVVQGAQYHPVNLGFVTRLNVNGAAVWTVNFGEVTTALTTRQVRVSNDGLVWVAGNFSGSLALGGGVTLRADETNGYLFALEADGSLHSASRILPGGWLWAGIQGMVVDDEDNVALIGYGNDANDVRTTFLTKLTPSFEVVFQKELQHQGLFTMLALAVDRRMRLTVNATVDRDFTYEGQTFDLEPPVFYALWLAQFSRDGDLLWQQKVDGGATPTLSYVAVTDRFDNILMGGASHQLRFGDEQVGPTDQGDYSFAFKLRPDGTKLWAHVADDVGWPRAMTTNAAGEVWVAARGKRLVHLTP